MGRRVSPGVLVDGSGRKGQLGWVRIAARAVVILSAVLWTVSFAAWPATGEAQPADDQRSAQSRISAGVWAYRVAVPLVMRNAPGLCDCIEPVPQGVLIQVEDIDGHPVEGALVVGIYVDADGHTSPQRRVTGKDGMAVFPTSDRTIIFEVQFPVGMLPCPGSAPRIQVDPGVTTVRFVGCRL